MSSRSTRRHRPAPQRRQLHAVADTPDQPLPPNLDLATLTRLIAAGALDDQLPTLAQAVAGRRAQIAAQRSLSMLATLGVGDRVRVTHTARPLYLHGATGTVTGWAGERVVVQLDYPVGRFTTGEVRCPPLALEKTAE
jgi:hypothetical protein